MTSDFGYFVVVGVRAALSLLQGGTHTEPGMQEWKLEEHVQRIQSRPEQFSATISPDLAMDWRPICNCRFGVRKHMLVATERAAENG